MSAEEKRARLAERNLLIFNLFQQGVGAYHIARTFGITEQWVYRIVARVGAKRD